jgi:hypothetical protein
MFLYGPILEETIAEVDYMIIARFVFSFFDSLIIFATLVPVN